MTYERRLKEFDEIHSLTNPTVRKNFFLSLLTQLIRQQYILKQLTFLGKQLKFFFLSIPSSREKFMRLPFRDGERVALVRFPHGGTFEIPELTVNNRNREARRILGTQARGCCWYSSYCCSTFVWCRLRWGYCSCYS